MASFIDPQPRNAIRLLMAPSLQFTVRDAGPRHSQEAHMLAEGFTHNWALGLYYLIEGASDEASMGMFAWHRRTAAVLPIFLRQAVGAFAF